MDKRQRVRVARGKSGSEVKPSLFGRWMTTTTTETTTTRGDDDDEGDDEERKRRRRRDDGDEGEGDGG